MAKANHTTKTALTATNVVNFSERTKKVSDRPRSFYELYPMPFFNREKRLGWDVQPTGDYSADIEMGKQYAEQFLRSCDMTYGWGSLLPKITMDMVERGTRTDNWPDGTPHANGVIIGFMGVITKTVMFALYQQGDFNGGGAA